MDGVKGIGVLPPTHLPASGAVAVRSCSAIAWAEMLRMAAMGSADAFSLENLPQNSIRAADSAGDGFDHCRRSCDNVSGRIDPLG